MTILLKKNIKSKSAYNFRQDLSSDNYYMYLGKNTAWDNESSPPDILDNDDESIDISSDMYAIKKVTSTNACLVVPRYDWISGETYDQYSNTDSDLFSKRFYVLTPDMNVYKCISNNSTSSTVMPTGQSTSNIQTGDGYIWKFMYNLSSSVRSSFLTTNYLPVPTSTQKTSQHILVETNASYSTGTPPGGHGRNAYLELGASRIMIAQTFTGDESGTIDASSTYRRLGLLVNPELISTGETATGSVYSVNDSNSDIEANTARILYAENRVAVQRNTDQSENIKLILNFE